MGVEYQGLEPPSIALSDHKQGAGMKRKARNCNNPHMGCWQLATPSRQSFTVSFYLKDRMTEIFHPLAHALCTYNNQDWVRLKAGARISVYFSHVVTETQIFEPLSVTSQVVHQQDAGIESKAETPTCALLYGIWPPQATS